MRSTEWSGRASIIERVSAILDCFTAQDPVLSVREVARRTGLAQSTTWRLTTELVSYGFLERNGTGLSLGLKFFELGERAARPRTLRRLTYPFLEMLRQRTGHSVHLAVLDGAQVVYVDILHARSSPRMPSRIGGRVAAHATAVGKVLLAFSRPEIAESLMTGPLEVLTPRTITDPKVLRSELARVRSTGIATEREESAPGVSCVAAPLRIDSDEPMAAVSVSGPSDHLDIAGATDALQAALAELPKRAKYFPSRPVAT